MPELTVVGKPIPIVDGIPKTVGQAKFVEDIRLPGMLCARILRSPHAHARIAHIDTSRARQVRGVKSIVTAADTPGIKYIILGPPYEDRLPLAADKVRFIGEEVGAVAAVDEDAASEALELIRIEYEELPAVFDPEEAMRPGAPSVHDVEKNVAARSLRHFGDVERGFLESDHIFEDRFSAPAQAHCSLETQGTLASFDAGGNLSVWTTTQSSYYVRKEVAHVLGLSASKVRVREVYTAGSFGSRSKICTTESICALLALKAERPVRLILSREEEFTVTRVSHPTVVYLKTGVTKNGQITARHIRVIVDNGAYNNTGPSITSASGLVLASLYRVPNVKYEGLTVYTNKQPGGSFRGYGSPQVVFAMESQMDMIAERLGIDGVELRLRHANQPGETTTSGWKITSCGLSECISTAASHAQWDEIKADRTSDRGVGIASVVHPSGARIHADGDYSSAIVRVDTDGTVTLYSGFVDSGQWSKTTMIQVAAEELGARFEDIRIVSMDTELTPVDLGSYASRTAFITGNAVRLAAGDARRQLIEAAADVLEANPRDLVAANGRIFVAGNPERHLGFGEAILASSQITGQSVFGKGHYDPPTGELDRKTGYGNFSAAYSFGAQAVEVEVDKGKGQVRVLKCVAAFDVGHPLNPLAVEGQIEGAIAQGLGFALSESQVYDRGRAMVSSFADYRAPRATDLPEIEVILVETDDPMGPFGAKSVGESGMVPTAAAVANAVYDAIGVRIKDLPITPEKVLAALREKSNQETAG